MERKWTSYFRNLFAIKCASHSRILQTQNDGFDGKMVHRGKQVRPFRMFQHGHGLGPRRSICNGQMYVCICYCHGHFDSDTGFRWVRACTTAVFKICNCTTAQNHFPSNHFPVKNYILHRKQGFIFSSKLEIKTISSFNKFISHRRNKFLHQGESEAEAV